MKKAAASSATKILSAASLQKKLARIRGQGKQIVFTNGCFDLLHAGHVRYLEQARTLGHVLVVALNSDASTRRLKGPKRPVNTLKDRQRVMAALGAVDFVTAFSEDTPLKLILKLKPTILVKGGDWSQDLIVGGKEVLNWGGKALSLPYLAGKSTTAILKRGG
jgi:D-beta-D-heptose 7-phosphate kinase/D-beta-D-heptose 1-phosphate adenosyltransferase